MSFIKSAFSIKKTEPRKHVSHSPLKLSADEMNRELGPKCEVIDVRIADKKISFNAEHGEWNSDGAENQDSGAENKDNGAENQDSRAENQGSGASSSVAQELRKQIEVLEHENNMLKLKVEALLNLVAESIAELSIAQK